MLLNLRALCESENHLIAFVLSSKRQTNLKTEIINYLWTNESRSIHNALCERWQHIGRDQVLREDHGEIVKERQHEHLKEVHDHEKLEVPVCQDLPRLGSQHGKGNGGLVRTVLHRGSPIRLALFAVKAALAVEACVEHADAAQDSHQDGEGLEGGKVFHVVGDHAAEEDAGGADERGHL